MRYLHLIFAPDALNTASKFRCVRAILERERERLGIRVGVCVKGNKQSKAKQNPLLCLNDCA